jgi:hypothetical protein
VKKNLFRKCACVSATFFVVVIGLYAYTWIFDPNLYSYPHPSFFHISLGNVRVSLERYDGGQVVFFNGPMPNDRTTVGLSDDMMGWIGYGIYYRVISDATSKVTWWTLMISIWYPIILFGILPAIFAVKKLRARKSASTTKTTIVK